MLTAAPRLRNIRLNSVLCLIALCLIALCLIALCCSMLSIGWRWCVRSRCVVVFPWRTCPRSSSSPTCTALTNCARMPSTSSTGKRFHQQVMRSADRLSSCSVQGFSGLSQCFFLNSVDPNFLWSSSCPSASSSTLLILIFYGAPA